MSTPQEASTIGDPSIPPPPPVRSPLTLAAPAQSPALNEPPEQERVFSLHSPPAAEHDDWAVGAAGVAGAALFTQHWI